MTLYPGDDQTDTPETPLEAIRVFAPMLEEVRDLLSGRYPREFVAFGLSRPLTFHERLAAESEEWLVDDSGTILSIAVSFSEAAEDLAVLARNIQQLAHSGQTRLDAEKDAIAQRTALAEQMTGWLEQQKTSPS